MTERPVPTFAKNMRLIGWCDQGGKPDGNQLMVHRGYAYVGNMYSKGFSIIDVRDPAAPRFVKYIEAPLHTWNIHLQAHDDLLLVVNGRDMKALPAFADDKSYYKGKSTGINLGPKEGRTWTSGMSVWDLSRPEDPREIGFMPVEGFGLHRIWYVGGRWAYASALLDGFSDYIMITIDMADPTKPVETGRFWLPGMNLEAGETPNWPLEYGRYGLHHPIVHGDTAYCSWRDGCLAVVDVADRAKPKLVTHKIWAPPFGGGTHNALPLPDRDLLVVVDEAVLDHQEDGDKPIWLFDIRERSNPVSISTFPAPKDADYKARPGHFGPHNIHENRPGSFVSSELIFATYQNAGVRVFDIRDKYAPVEVGALVPPAPARMMNGKPGREPVIQMCDVFVDKDGLVFTTDHHAGLCVMEFNG
ncbi:MAG: repeat family protein [Brevundimonas sp.]|nr:repeat family protein [Brevundimonas sp.]